MDKTELLSRLSKPKITDVTIGDEKYFIRAMTLHQRDQYDSIRLGLPKDAEGNMRSLSGLRSFLIAACVCDEAGNRIFEDADVSSIENGCSDEMLELAIAIGKFNRLYGDDDEKN